MPTGHNLGPDPALTPDGAKPVSRLGASRFDPGQSDGKRLLWHVGDNLRWLADNPAATHLPCGMLHGAFLISVATNYERLCEERIAQLNERHEAALAAKFTGATQSTEETKP